MAVVVTVVVVVAVIDHDYIIDNEWRIYKKCRRRKRRGEDYGIRFPYFSRDVSLFGPKTL